jgi:hypothetical protein
MRRNGVLLIFTLAACGEDGGAGVAPLGSFRLVGETVNGTATAAGDLNGALELTAAEYGLAIARPAPHGLVASYTISGDALVLGGGDRVTVNLDGDRLTLRPDGDRVWSLDRITTAPAEETFPVAGTVELPRGAAPPGRPRIALIRYTRELDRVAFFHDPRDDRELSLESGTANFDLSRDRAALGTDRITFGTTAGIAIELIVVYDDRDASDTLAELFTPCSEATTDCILGVSPIAIGYRDGASAELAASPYALLRKGWSNAVPVTDRRTGKLGLVSADPDRALVHQIILAVDPAQVTVPGFQL